MTEDPDGDFVVTAFDANHCPGLYYHLLLQSLIGTLLRVLVIHSYTKWVTDCPDWHLVGIWNREICNDGGCDLWHSLPLSSYAVYANGAHL